MIHHGLTAENIALSVKECISKRNKLEIHRKVRLS
jgi:hypothetical protein